MARSGRGAKRWVFVAALALVAAVAVVAVVIVARGDSDPAPRDVAAPPATTPLTPVPTGPMTGPPATPLATTAAPIEDRSVWRFGYAGLGPVKLGMTLAEASVASGEELVLDDHDACQPPQRVRAVGAPLDNLAGDGFVGYSADNGRIVNIWANGPAWPTISGIRVGSTEDDVRRMYSNAQADAAPDGRPMITITNPEGRVVAFLMHEGRVVTIVALSSLDALRAGLYCRI